MTSNPNQFNKQQSPNNNNHSTNNKYNNYNMNTNYMKGNLNRINRALMNGYQINNKPIEKVIETQYTVSDAQRSKFQKLIEIIGYKMSHQKLSEFFDTKCRQSAICWSCCVDIKDDSINKIIILNRNVTPYKCNHFCANTKRKGWRKKLTANDGLYYEHTKSFKQNMIKIREIYKPSTNIILDATKKRKRKLVVNNNNNNINNNKPVRKKRKKELEVEEAIDISLEKLKLETIIKVEHNESFKINMNGMNGINCMNEWYKTMIILRTNYNNLNTMYFRIEKQIQNSELLPIIIQIKKRYNDSVNKLKLKSNIFENEWRYWNKQQIIYWIKNIQDGHFGNNKYQIFINQITKNKLINVGNDMLNFNDLALLLLGLENDNDRNIMHKNIDRLTTISNQCV